MRYLDQVFGPRMLAMGSIQGETWAPSSPDLSALDFCVWNELKCKVYTNPIPQTIDQLKDKIRLCVDRLDEGMVARAVQHMKRRAQMCLQQNGGHFEGLRINLP